MRTLKKSLALILVFAMILSFGVIGASAAFTDVTSSTKYSEAIDVMAGIGVINGMTTTTFEPDGGLTRAQASKIIAYMLLGSTNAELIKDASAQRFTDVSATHWAAGYIEYCTNLGIISGIGDNKFDPEGKLTVAAFTKLLLGALGYDAAIEGFTGDSWAINVASTAVKADIAEDGIPISNTRVITRGEACQLAYLTLQATLVEYENKGTTITVGGIEIVTGASTAKEVTSKTLSSRFQIKDDRSTDGTATVEFAEKYFTKLTKDTTSINGRAGYYWLYNGTRISGFVTDDTVLASSGSGTSYANLTNTANSDYIGYKPSTDGVTYMYNDVEASEFSATTAYAVGDVVKYNDVVYKCTAAHAVGVWDGTRFTAVTALVSTVGVVVKFVDTDSDGRYDIVSVVERRVSQLTGDAYTKTSGAVTNVTIPGVFSSKNIENVTYPSGLEEDDVVLWYESAGNYYVEKATEISGTMSSYSSSKYTVAGTAYKLAGLNGVEVAGTDPGTRDSLTALLNQSNYTYYVDTYGNIVFVEGLTTAANLGKTVFVEAVDKGESFGGVNPQAKIVNMDGTRATVDIDKTNGTAVTDPDEILASGTATQAATAGTLVAKYFYTYTKNSDGSYNLTYTANQESSANNITAKRANFLAGSSVIGNNSTVFLYKTGTSSSFNVYTGISNTRDYTGGNTYVLTNSAKTTALAVVAIGGTSKVSTSSSYDQVFVVSGESAYPDGDNVTFYGYSVIKNGVAVTFYSYDPLEKGELYLCDDDYTTYDGKSILEAGAKTQTADDVVKYTAITAPVTHSGGVLTITGTRTPGHATLSSPYNILLNGNYKIFYYDADEAATDIRAKEAAVDKTYTADSVIYTVETSSSDDSIAYVYIYNP